ncbi:MAG: hypothetical protein PWP62_2745 [Eubacteriaceae bacterium]|jgi:hypothetical protein|nr:hypothetical protein [Eubacteriaceae bacterium]MDK2962266.1 hypothetical protein [Eubacteriaceae bacterium]
MKKDNILGVIFSKNKKYKKRIILIICSLIIMIMALSVPSREEYDIWVANKYGIVATKDASFTGIYLKGSEELFEESYSIKRFTIFIIETHTWLGCQK